MSAAVLPTSAASSAAVPPHVLGYRALKLWQRALDLAAEAYRLARVFPETDQLTVGADFRRAAAAVPAAVAVSAQSIDRWERQRALQATASALARAETLAALAERVGALAPADATSFLFVAGDVSRLLRGFVRSTAARMAGLEPAVRHETGAGEAAELAPVSAVAPEPGSAAQEIPAAPPSMRAPARGSRGGRRRAGGDETVG